MKIVISKLPCAVHYGDWHDRPLKWLVTVSWDIGPPETQKFSTKRDALLYARIRRSCATEWQAIREFSNTV